VTALMTTTTLTAAPDDDLGAVARVIVERRIGAVPIVDGAGVLVGILSVVDVLRRLADEADADARAVAMID
jgi:CBS domain-containing protein